MIRGSNGFPTLGKLRRIIGSIVFTLYSDTNPPIFVAFFRDWIGEKFRRHPLFWTFRYFAGR
jgi:hypothetical protein